MSWRQHTKSQQSAQFPYNTLNKYKKRNSTNTKKQQDALWPALFPAPSSAQRLAVAAADAAAAAAAADHRQSLLPINAYFHLYVDFYAYQMRKRNRPEEEGSACSSVATMRTARAGETLEYNSPCLPRMHKLTHISVKICFRLLIRWYILRHFSMASPAVHVVFPH